MSRSLARRAAELAARGLYCCQVCRKEKPLWKGIVISWGGSVLLGVCPECFPAKPVVLERADGGVRVRMADDATNRVIAVSSIQELDRFIPKSALPKVKRFEPCPE